MPSVKSQFHSLYEKHADELKSFARRRVGNDDSMDVVHDTYLRLISYTDPTSLDNPRAYLFSVARNVANDYGTKSLRRTSAREPDTNPDEIECSVSDPERRIDVRNTLDRCLSALGELPPTYRHVFLLHRIDGMTQGEIATALNLPKRTVERYIAKTLAHCQRKL